MAVLAYCITEAEREIELPAAGIQGAPIEAVAAAGLRCFASQYAAPAKPNQQPVREMALDFHRVLQEIFRQAAIVPFRFPTILAGESEIAAFLREHRAEYVEALARLKDKVQVDIRVCSEPAEPGQGVAAARSGTDYLRSQQARHQHVRAAAGEVQRAGEPWIESWREREMSNGVRCFALIRRASVEAFLKRIEKVRMPADVSARATGPWPATEFVKES